MVKIIRDNSSGKTKELITFLSGVDKHSILVCGNVPAMYRKIDAYGFTGVECISYQDFLHSKRDKETHYYIDNIDSFLETIGCSGYTLSTN